MSNLQNPSYHNEEHHNRLKGLENKISNLPITVISTNFGADDALAVQVYQTATRIYFARASQSSWKLSKKINTVIDNVFAGPLPGHACGHFFPVFILTCEARTDEQRIAVLSLMDSTERNARIKGVKGLRKEIQKIWVKQDLEKDSELLVNYLGMMSAVSSETNVPTSLVWAA
jgi:hypothetical protein